MRTIKCRRCYPSPAFPLSCDKPCPSDYEEYRKWDDWYIWRYLLEKSEDEEEIYQIYSSTYYHVRETMSY